MNGYRGKPCATALVSRIARVAAIGLVVLCFSACPPGPTEDLPIEEVTIYNIPKKIPVDGESGENDTFKVYLNASNSMSEYDPPAAQGFKKLKEDNSDNYVDGVTEEESNGTLTVTIRLKKPIVNLKYISKGVENPTYDSDKDPNDDGGDWSGTARFFSVTISPKDVSQGVKVIWGKGSNSPLNKSRASVDWNSSSLINFREKGGLAVFVEGKAEALFDDLINRDKDIDPKYISGP